MRTINERFGDDPVKMTLQAIAAVILAFVSAKLMITSFIGLDAWFHPEGISSFLLILQAPIDQYGDIIFDGRYVDPNPARIRPISHVVELIDSLSRMTLARFFGPNLILNSVSSLVFIAVVPFTLYCIFRRFLEDRFLSAAITLLCITSTPVLSTLFFVMRPAKRLTILFGILCVLVLVDYFRRKQDKTLILGFAAIVGLMLSDEEGIFTAAILFMLFLLAMVDQWASVRGKVRIIAWSVAVPLLAISIGATLLTAQGPVYHGMTHDQPIVTRIGEFLASDFFTEIVSAKVMVLFSSGFGFFGQAWANFLVLAAVAAALALVLRRAWQTHWPEECWQPIFFCCAALVCFVWHPLFAGLLNQVGGGPLFFMANNYYYGSSVAIAQLILIVGVLSALTVLMPGRLGKAGSWGGSAVAIVFAVLAFNNLTSFQKINTLVEFIHYTPNSSVNFNAILMQQWQDRRDCSLPANPPLIRSDRVPSALKLLKDLNLDTPGNRHLIAEIYGKQGNDPERHEPQGTPSWIVDGLIGQFDFCKNRRSESP